MPYCCVLPVWLSAAAQPGFIAFRMGVNHRRQTAEALIGSAEAEAERIKHEAEAAAEAQQKGKVAGGQGEIHRLRNESEKELKERRVDVQRQERRIQQKEETLDRKIDNYEKKEEAINKKQREIDARLEDVENLKKGQFEMLERISGFTAEQAKDYLLTNLEEELTHEKALKIAEFETQLKDEADQKARNLISPRDPALCCRSGGGNHRVGGAAAQR